MKFRFMHPFRGWVLDFFAPAVGLCIEVDGGIHDSQQEYDAARTKCLNQHGVRVLRIRNEAVLHHLPVVLTLIEEAILATALGTVHPQSV